MEGLTTIPSSFGAKETMDRLAAEIRSHNMVIFARIDHSTGAAEAGLVLLPTELIIFGNARAGTPLMQAEQTVGIDLPLKALVWENAARKTWISYNEPGWIVQRHNVSGAEVIVNNMAAALAVVTRNAAGLSADGGVVRVRQVAE